VEYLRSYLKINVEDEIKRLSGVGDATTCGQLEFSMLLSLDPDRMAQLGVTVAEVAAAVREPRSTPSRSSAWCSPSASWWMTPIVVIENVERIMAEEHCSPAEAADKAMGQVTGALIAITGVFGGMLLATIVGVFFIPLFFRVIVGATSRAPKKAALGETASKAVPEPAGWLD
jgi:multidrug efflux pump subunit AcrB